MLLRTLLAAAVAAAAATVHAQEPRLAFKPAGAGLYDFDTGALRGRLKLDGRFQGVYPLVDTESGADLTHPPGVFSPYRVFKTGTRFGHAARDWPTTSKRLEDGAVAVHWAAAKDHPLEIDAVYRWRGPDTLDLAITVKSQQDMPDFEVFMSSYFTKGFRASVYMKPQGEAGGQPRFVPVDRKPGSKGGYVMFPRDEKAVRMIQDGRWKIPPNAVDWAIERWLAAPLILRRDAQSGITAVMMCPPDECFALSSPWNPATPEGGGYRSLYLSLFGRDLKAAQESRARCRVVIGRGITDQRAAELYEAYVKEARSGARR